MNRGRMLFTAGAMLALCAAASGQVRPTQAGRELDMNYQIGSGGYNLAPARGGAFNSQLYVTGQTTGLSRFRGNVPYAAENQLRLDVPSARLSTFRQESVGLPQIIGRSGYGVLPYYDRTTTVFNVRGIKAGLTSPGSNVPLRSTIPPPLAKKLYRDVTADYKPIIESPAGQRMYTTPFVPAPSPAAPPPRAGWAGGEAVSRPGATSIFAVLRAEDQQELARELMQLGMQDRRLETRVETEADTRTRVVPEAVGAVEPPGPQEPEGAKTDLTTYSTGLEPAMPRPNQDVFLDILVTLRQRRRQEQRFSSGRIVPPVEQPSEGAEAGEPSAAESPTKSPSLVELLGERGVVVIHGLAGAGGDLFNQTMAEAQRNLKAGKFYRAVDSYEAAIIIDSGNPLARIGQGLARLGAGEPLSAALQIQRAMRLFPPIMETRLDIAAMLPIEAVEYQLERVDARLEASGRVEPSLALLSAFVHHNLGHKAEAARSARLLRSAAGDDELLKAYASYLLTGRHPTTRSSPTRRR